MSGFRPYHIEQYFNTEVIGKEVIDSVHILVGAFLGRFKEQLDAVDTSVPLDMAIQSLGGFLRYHVTELRKTPKNNSNHVWMPFRS